MASPVTHLFAASTLAPALLGQGATRRVVVAGAILSLLPDLDVVGFALGVPYGHFWGHRGFSHSLVFAAAVALAATAALARLSHRFPTAPPDAPESAGLPSVGHPRRMLARLARLPNRSDAGGRLNTPAVPSVGKSHIFRRLRRLATGTGEKVGLARGRQPRAARLFAYLFVVTASHGLFDAMTDGGRGVAFFSPFDDHRYFLPLRPVAVSPLGIAAFLSFRAVRILASEIVWIWLPWAVACGLLWLARGRPRGAGGHPG